MIDFGDLAKTTVRIGVGKGKEITCPMLALDDMKTFEDTTLNVAKFSKDPKLSDDEKFDLLFESRRVLVGLAQKSVPYEYHAGVCRMDFAHLCKLVSVLCTGKDGEEEPEKKSKAKK